MDILNLSGWQVTHCIDNEDHYIIEAKPVTSLTNCPHCGSPTLIGHGKDAQRLRDLPVHGKQVVIQIRHQRYFCKQCHKTCFEPLLGIEDCHQMTTRLVRYIERKAISTTRTFNSIAEEIGIDPGTVRGICLDHIAKLDQTSPFETPTVLGIDELYVLQQARGIMTNVQAGTIIDLLADRRKTTIIHRLRQIPHPERIATVVTDCWRPYREAVQQVLPSATLVADKWHVLKLATAALEKYRKEVSTSLTDAQRKTLKMHDRFLLLRREHDLSPENHFVLESWTRNFPLLGQAHRLKENFFAIYDQPCRDAALDAYIAWMESVPKELYHVYWPLMLTVEEWGDQIFAHFTTGVTGGFVESANNIARCLNRLGRGYGIDVLRGRLLYGWRSAQVSSVGKHPKGIPIPTLVASHTSLKRAALPTTDS